MESRTGSTVNQYIATIIINITMLSYGCSVGWLSPTILKLQSDESPAGYSLSDGTISWTVSCLCLGALISTPLFGFLADTCGRKKSILAISVPSVVSWLLMLCYPKAWSLILSRILIGISAGGSLILIPMYVAEISEPCCRGALGLILTFLNILGVVLGYLSGGLLDYRPSVAVFVGLPLLHMVLFVWLPETPIYLIKRGRIQEAAKALSWLRSLDVDSKMILYEMDQLQVESRRRGDSSQFTLKQIVQNRGTRRSLSILLMMLTIQGWSGGYPIMNYVSVIFDAALGSSFSDVQNDSFVRMILSSTGSSVFVGLVMLFGSFIGIFLIEKCGRKPLLIGSFMCLSICMVSLGIWFYLKEYYPEIPIPGWLPITATSLCVFGNVTGIASVPWVFISEVLSFEVRSAISVAVLIWVWVLAFMQLKVFTPLITLMGYHGLLWSFAVTNIIGIFFTIFFVPETKGRTLEDIALQLTRKGNIYSKTKNISDNLYE